MRTADDSGSKWLWVEIGLGAALLGGVYLTKIHGEWWRELSPFARKMVEGISLAGFGIAFLWVRWKARRVRPMSPWEFRAVLFEIALLVGGVVCLVESWQAR